jgi:SAM-dependent methyltransferase
MKLDLGCGTNKREGFLGVDASTDCGADVVHDLTQAPWPFADASVDEAYSHHFLEHLDGPERIRFMEELYRVLKPGAQALIITPYWTWVGAIQDPTHKWPPIAEESYLYFNAEARRRMGLGHYAIHCDFDLQFGGVLAPEIEARPPAEQSFAKRHYFNAVLELRTTLTRRAA